nr:unnamed protein product [Spirometra erinaceieuropaei]
MFCAREFSLLEKKMENGGFSYMMLPQKKLSFQQAEQFCFQDSSRRMHIASVLNEEEWILLSKMFGSEQPIQIWLGGEAKRSPAKPTFNLFWIDQRPFSYHRFSKEEQNTWLDKKKPLNSGCLAADIKMDGSGNWTVVHAPCSEARAFICKGVHQPDRSDHLIRRPFLNALSQWPLDLLINRLTSWRLLDPWLLHELQREAAAEDVKPLWDTTAAPIHQGSNDGGPGSQTTSVVQAPVTTRTPPGEGSERTNNNSAGTEESTKEGTGAEGESMLDADVSHMIDSDPKSTGLELDDDHELALINDLLNPKVNHFNIGDEPMF